MRGPLIALAGAILAVVLAALGAWGFIEWRSAEQQRRLAAHAEACYAAEQVACDQLRAACEKRSGIACAALATRYLEGRGIAPDPAEGLRLLDEACRAHHARSCVRSATIRRQEGREVDKAREAMQKACSLGLDSACEAP